MFDADGRLTQVTLTGGTTWSYLYDAEGRLTSACKSSSCTGSGFFRLDSTYNAEGHRTRLVETPASGTATTIDFTYEGDKVVREVATTGAVVVTRTFTVDEAGTIRKMVYASVPADATNDGTYLVTYNGHGDAVLLSMVDTDGTLLAANRFTYTTWGTPTTSLVGSYGDLGFRYRYVGAHDVQWDGYEGAGLLYMHARHYHPEFGRFLQPDPSELEANHYAYAENNPVSKIDPSGTIAWFAIAFVAVRVFTAAAPLVHRAAPAVQRALPTAQRVTPMAQRVTPVVQGSTRFLSFTARNLRENLARLTGVRPPGAHAHHVFPQKFRPIFANAGIKIDDPRYAAWWHGPSHLRYAQAYNLRWESFLRTNPSPAQILRFGRQIMAEYGLRTNY